MAVAFTREEDYESRAADLPDRPISPHPNLVTASGMVQIEAELAAARAAYSDAQVEGGIAADRTAMSRATRDLRYWSSRRASAQLTEPAAEAGKVQFGGTVEVEREDGRRQTFRIVGEDEADPAKGSVSYVSPLARPGIRLRRDRKNDVRMMSNLTPLARASARPWATLGASMKP
jgi:transcription elongation GreA/GreB family factor